MNRKQMIRKIEKYLKNTKPGGFAHGYQLGQLEGTLKDIKRGNASKEEIDDAYKTIKKLKA